LIRLTTSAGGANEGGCIATFPAGTTNITGIEAANWVQEWIIRPQTVANVVLQFGFLALPQNAFSATSSASRGVYVRFHTGEGDTNFMGVVGGLNGTEVRRTASLGVAPSANTYYKFRIRRISTTQFGFSVNGGAETTVTTTVGDNNYNPSLVGMSLHTLTAAAASADVDFFSLILPTTR
jgi:hypothetical protein